MRVLGLSGSLRSASYNTALLEAAARELPPGVVFEPFDGIGDVPLYNADRDGGIPHPAVGRLRDALAAADAVLVSTPEYNASIPGVLKNALDWASRPFPDNSLRGTPVAVIGTSTGLFGAVWAQAELRKVFAFIGARVLDAELPVGQARQAFDETGNLRDPELREALASIVERLVAMAAPAEEGGYVRRSLVSATPARP